MNAIMDISNFFYQRLRNYQSQDSKKPTLKAPEVSAENFKFFIEFATRDDLYDGQTHGHLSYTKIAELWLAGEYLQSGKFQAATLVEWCARMARTGTYNLSEINFVWERTKPQSLLRAFLLEVYSYAPHNNLFDGVKARKLPATFLLELLKQTDINRQLLKEKYPASFWQKFDLSPFIRIHPLEIDDDESDDEFEMFDMEDVKQEKAKTEDVLQDTNRTRSSSLFLQGGT